jgi:putative ABC transport system substrate-binding protein
MKRRQFMTLMGGTVTAWSVPAQAQKSAAPVIGFLSSTSAAQWSHFIAAFLQGLGEQSYTEGANVGIEYRWAEGQYGRLPGLAGELVGKDCNVIVAVSPPAAKAAQAATSKIPIVFVSGVDPVALGLVASINRPGANITGFNFATAEVVSKIMQTIVQLIPQLKSFAFLMNPQNPNAASQARDAQAAAKGLGREAHILPASSPADIDAAFDVIKARSIDALIVATDAYFVSRTSQLVDLSRKLHVPTVYALREYVASGGLLSYGTSVTDAYRQVGVYAGRILKGAKPADLPVLQPTKFEITINLKTAKELGLSVPDNLLALANEVFE